MCIRDRFDLVCTAHRTNEHYRIDLAKGEWCYGPCGFVQKIKSVTSGLIVLLENDADNAEKGRYYNRINRASGEWEWYNSNPGSYSAMDIRGTCAPAPFSGFPAAKF